jgi:hypothetical protein
MFVTSGDLTITSWGWEMAEDERWRKWRVRKGDKLVAVLTVPEEDPYEVLLLAGRLTDTP